MKRTHLIITAVFCIVVPLSEISAGKPEVEITVKNDYDGGIQVLAFDGDDATCQVPRSQKSAGKGDTIKIRCRGKGKHRCKLGMEHTSAEQWTWCSKPVKDGGHCTISKQADSHAKLDCDD